MLAGSGSAAGQRTGKIKVALNRDNCRALIRPAILKGETMKKTRIELLRDTVVNRSVYSAGAIVETDERQAEFLISIGKAKLAAEPAAEPAAAKKTGRKTATKTADETATDPAGDVNE